MVEEYYQHFFERGQMARWMVDVELLVKRCEDLRGVGPTDAQKYALYEQKLVREGVGLLRSIAVSAECLKLFGMDSHPQFVEAFAEILSGSDNAFIHEVIHLLLGRKVSGRFFLNLDIPEIGTRDLKVFMDYLPGENLRAAVFSLIDITKEESERKDLKESMEKYRLLITAANDGILICDVASGLVEEVNPKAQTMFNREIGELVGVRHELLIPEEERAEYLGFYTDELSGKKQGNVLSTFIVKNNGEGKMPVEINIAGAVIGNRGVAQISFHDVRRRLQLEQRRRLLATAVEQTAESVMITDPKGIVIYVNPAFEKTSGYSFTEVIGQSAGMLRSDHVSRMQTKLMWKEISAGKVWQGIFTNRRKDGSVYKEQATITPVKDGSGGINHYVTVKRDITKQSALEQQVRQSQKMQAIGTLAGGVAHDFNNILTAIMGYAELTQVQCPKDSVMYDNLTEVIKGAERAGELVDQILKFSRQSEKVTASLRIDLIIKEVLKLLRASLPANIDIEFNLNKKLYIKADPTQMHQVIMNLCTNAYQALEVTGGKIKVNLDSVHLTLQQGLEIGNLNYGEYVCITVEDSGVGIPAEYLPRIFEPYFTTRDKNEGTGLGLSVVHGIINDHGGAVTVDSVVGKGTIFRLYLPVAEYLDEREVLEVEHNNFKGGRILVVDDEPNIVNFQVQVLEHFGYEVFPCITSTEAMAVFEEQKGEVDLVITDMGMPEMTGLELFEKMKKINPEVKVLLCTGYSKQVTQENASKKGFAGYLSKPFNGPQLANKVSSVLDGR